MEMIKTEWKKIRKNKILLLSFVVICFIPMLYASFFLKSMWDPYGMTQHLPIAVVNEDKSVDFEGQTLSVGAQVIDQLKENDLLEWHFVSAEDAKKGLENKEYYMVITLPENFSANAATVLSDNPEKMNIEYETNGSLNYLGEVISEQAVKELKSEVSEQVTKAYASAIFDQLTSVSGGFTAAADGSAQLKDGIDKVKDGNKEISTNLAKLADASLTFSDGTNTLSLGLSQYIDGVDAVKAGASELNSGLSQFESGMNEYTSGVKTAAAGANQLNKNSAAINEGLNQVVEGVQMIPEQLGSTLESLSKNSGSVKKLAEGMSAADNAINQLKGATSQLAAGIPDSDSISALKQMLNKDVFNAMSKEQQAAVLEKTSQLIDGYTTVGNAVNQIDGGLSSLAKQTPALVNGTQAISDQLSGISTTAPQLISKLQELSNGAKTLQTGVKTYTSGVAQLTVGLNQLNANSPKLTQAVTSLAGGTNSLMSGLDQLTANNDTLKTGVTQLADGATQIHDGATKLADGSNQLDQGLTDLAAGASELNTGLTEGSSKVGSIEISDASIDMIAAPDTITQIKYSDVPNYGHALAPYVLSLSLYVGCMIFNFIYPIRKVAMEGKSSVQWWLSKLSVGFVAATAMAFLETGIMLLLGITTNNLLQYFIMALVTAYAFMFLIMVLAMAFDNPGRCVAMILLVLQLAGSGGTFPMQLTAKFFNVIHPFLPMSYAITGFRQAISGGLGTSTFINSMGVLIGIAVVSIVLLFLAMDIIVKHHKAGISQLDDNQKLFDTNYDYAKTN